jgi:glycerophosphoryl diester phosphodiesterase
VTGRGVEHPYFALPGPWLIAHRGGAALAPENTLVAFEGADALGADALETDVRLSRDGHVMVFHDADTARLCGVSGSIEERTLVEIERLDAGFSFMPDPGGTFPWRGRGVRVPTLAEALERLPRMRFNVDAKSRDPALAGALATLLRRTGTADRVCVGSAYHRQARRLRELLPEWSRFLPGPEALAHVLSAWRLFPGFACAEGFDLAALSRRAAFRPCALRAVASHFRARGMPVQLWTVDGEAEMRRLLAAGVHGLMTDRPDLLANAMGR